MTAQGWIGDSLQNVRERGVWGGIRSLYNLYDGIWFNYSSRFNHGTNVFTDNWDVLIVLDACRVDATRQEESNYSFINEVGSINSVGTVTTEWMSNTFSSKYQDKIQNTGYVCSNPQAKVVFDDRNFPPGEPSPLAFPNWDVVTANDFQFFDRTWEYGFDSELNTIPPDVVTDRGINIMRENPPDRLILHYTQPHIPFIPSTTPVDDYRDFETRDDLTPEAVWDSYVQNLQVVLDSVERLLNNIDAERVRITADHGDAIGEFNIYGHPGGFFHPVIRRVPWIETSAEDTGISDPEDPSEGDSVNEEAEGILEDLGYII